MATRHLRDPGMILYRDSKGKKLLLLFLVGETTTGGIHRVAFQTALRQIEELPSRVGSMTEAPAQKSRCASSAHTFQVRPIHSRSCSRGGWADKRRRPKSGSLREARGQLIKKIFWKKNALNEDSFYGVEVNSALASEEFYEDLMNRDRLIEPPDGGGPARAYIALLSETGTGRGQIPRQRIRKLNKEAIGKKQPLVLSMPYPVHISQLRVEAAKSSLRNDANNAPFLSVPAARAVAAVQLGGDHDLGRRDALYLREREP
jgi:hypothetical protein